MSSETLDGGSSPAISSSPLRLDTLPPIHVLSTHMEESDVQDVEDKLIGVEAPITFDVREAKIFIGKVVQKRRAMMELRARGRLTEEWQNSPQTEEGKGAGQYIDLTRDSQDEPAPKRARIDEGEGAQLGLHAADMGDSIIVLHVAWLDQSLKERRLVPLDDYLVYRGRLIGNIEPISKHVPATIPVPSPLTNRRAKLDALADTQAPVSAKEILERARRDGELSQGQVKSNDRRRFHSGVASQDLSKAYSSTTQRSSPMLRRGGALVTESTTEHDVDLTRDLPEPPDWVREGRKYACERSTPINGPNEDFIATLKSIRVARLLTADEIGVRAYSTAIAAIAAYPYTLTSPREILALPGCSAKIATLFAEWANNGRGRVAAADEADDDPRLKVLRVFYDIWGVGATTARSFYDRGWRDLDDVVEFGWDTLSRVQQVGVKFYDEFKLKIARAEVEAIRNTVEAHVRRVRPRDPRGVRTCIVGGYRRGKAESGDADIIVSHLDERETLDLVAPLVASLAAAGWITHNLGTAKSGSKRAQGVQPYRGEGGGHGFDALDKAMVVWQDPRFEAGGDGVRPLKNPNVHRRVDIIIAPWSRIGCAVLGWSAGTTFERDLRRYAKHVKGWKFDSSGIRDRATGKVVDVEGVGGPCTTVEEAERKVFKGLGLVWREPWERCTG